MMYVLLIANLYFFKYSQHSREVGFTFSSFYRWRKKISFREFNNMSDNR